MKKNIGLGKKWWNWLNFSPILETIYRWMCENLPLIQILFDLLSIN